MTISIDPSLLVSYYQSKAGINANGSGTSTASASSAPSAPTPPWNQTPTATQISAQVQAAIDGQALINPGGVKLSSSGANPNYNNLFALYQGLSTLKNIATQASAPGQSSGQIDQLKKAFASGLAQLHTYLATKPFSGFQVVQGSDAAQQAAKLGVAPETDAYRTGTIFSGGANTPVPALQGDISFTATVTGTYGVAKTVNFNLDDMGSTPRTVGNVVNYLNSQLKAAGVATSFSVVHTAGTAQTISLANGQKVT
jgi:hypothetical protein